MSTSELHIQRLHVLDDCISIKPWLHSGYASESTPNQRHNVYFAQFTFKVCLRGVSEAVSTSEGRQTAPLLRMRDVCVMFVPCIHVAAWTD